MRNKAVNAPAYEQLSLPDIIMSVTNDCVCVERLKQVL